MDIACEGKKDNDINCNLLCSSSSLLSLTAVNLLQKEKSVTKNPFFWIILNEFLLNGLCPEKKQTGGLMIFMELSGVLKKQQTDFSGLD